MKQTLRLWRRLIGAGAYARFAGSYEGDGRPSLRVPVPVATTSPVRSTVY
jgi:hypothetical protein